MNFSFSDNNITDLPINKGKSVQAKLTVNKPGDDYEQEADAMADRILNISNNNSSPPVTGLIGKSVQRKCSHCEEEEKKRNPIMRKVAGGNADMPVSTSFSSSLNATKGSGSPMPSSTKNFMENAFSTDFSSVRIHTGNKASELSKGINAKAFTYGNDIYFGEGQYNPGSKEGKHLLAHELTHTIQQTRNINTKLIQRAAVHLYDYTDNFLRRGGYASEYCEDYSYITGQCQKNISGNVHAGINDIRQVPGWISSFSSRGITINTIYFHTHGSPGYVYLPNGSMNSTNVSILSPIVSHLPSNATIDFKGCNVGEGATGINFLLTVANTLLRSGGGRVKATDSVTFSVPGIGQRRPIWSSRPNVCIPPGGVAAIC